MDVLAAGHRFRVETDPWLLAVTLFVDGAPVCARDAGSVVPYFFWSSERGTEICYMVELSAARGRSILRVGRDDVVIYAADPLP